MTAGDNTSVEALALRVDELSWDVPVMRWSGQTGKLRGLHIIHCPAFADEMNKGRHLVAAAARLFASEGATVWIPDLHGTGDSEAEFTSGDWNVWIVEVRACVEAARAESAQAVGLWGNRLGALLATEVATNLQGPEMMLLLWQPVLSGDQFMRQFLRVLNVKTTTSDSTPPSLAADDASDSDVQEVAGYCLTHKLITDIKSAAVPPRDQIPCSALITYEVSPSVGKALSPKIQRWLEASVNPEKSISGVCRGDLYWASQELGYADELLATSLRSLGDAFVQQAGTSLQPFGASKEGTSPKLSPSARTFVFSGAGEQLVGHIRSGEAASRTGVGIVIVVGGPQYRVGSHRLFIKLAEVFASAGYPAMCFDHCGMGDSSGTSVGFERIGPELKDALSAFQVRCPDVQRVVLWGLCDGATASGLYAHRDSRVEGLILANPWVYSEGAKAAALLETHYKSRLVSADFWNRLFTGKVNVAGALAGFCSVVLKQLRPAVGTDVTPVNELPESAPLADRLFFALMRYDARVKVLLSEHDITAAEFEVALRRHYESSGEGKDEKDDVGLMHLSGADHTFSTNTATSRAAMESLLVLAQWFDNEASEQSRP